MISVIKDVCQLTWQRWEVSKFLPLNKGHSLQLSSAEVNISPHEQFHVCCDLSRRHPFLDAIFQVLAQLDWECRGKPYRWMRKYYGFVMLQHAEGGHLEFDERAKFAPASSVNNLISDVEDCFVGIE